MLGETTSGARSRPGWPVFDLAAAGVVTFLLLVFGQRAWSLGKEISEFLAAMWLVSLALYLLVRTEIFESSREKPERVADGYYFNSFGFFCITLAPLVLVALNDMRSFWPSNPVLAAIAPGMLLSIISAGVLLGVHHTDRSGGTWMSALFLKFSLLSAILALGAERLFGFLVPVFPSWLLTYNIRIRILIAAVWIGVVLFLVLLDVVRVVRRDKLGLRSLWQELVAQTPERQVAQDPLELIAEAMHDFRLYVGNILRITKRAVWRLLELIDRAFREIVDSLDVTSIAIAAAISLLLLVGLELQTLAPLIAAAVPLTLGVHTYDPALTLFGAVFTLWVICLGSLHAHLRENRHRRHLANILKICLFAILGVWLALSVWHLGAYFGVAAPGFRGINGVFFVLFGTLLLGFVIWENLPGAFRLVGFGVPAVITVIWAIRDPATLFQMPVLPTAVAPALEARSTPSRDERTEPTTTQTESYDWLSGTWGVDGTCDLPIIINRVSTGLTIAQGRQFDTVSVESATGGVVIAKPWRFVLDGSDISASFESTELGRLTPCRR